MPTSWLGRAAAKLAVVAAVLACAAVAVWLQHVYYVEGIAPTDLGRDMGQSRKLIFSGSGELLPSTYLNYRVPTSSRMRSWFSTFRCVNSAHSTFFAVQRTQYGYFGIQQTPTWAGEMAEKIGITSAGRFYKDIQGLVIFSVWDTAINRCSILATGDGAYGEGFGGEGTGCKIILNTQWGIADYSFVTTAEYGADDLIRLSGYWYDAGSADADKWKFVGTLAVHNEGRQFGNGGISSFVEQFRTIESSEERGGHFGPHFVETTTGDWISITQARFSQTKTNHQDYHVFGMVPNDDSFAMGVVGFSQLGASTPDGRVLTLPQPLSPRTFSQLQLYIRIRDSRLLPKGCVGETSCNVQRSWLPPALASVFSAPDSATQFLFDALEIVLVIVVILTICACCQCLASGRRIKQQQPFVQQPYPQPFRR